MGARGGAGDNGDSNRNHPQCKGGGTVHDVICPLIYRKTCALISSEVSIVTSHT